MALTDVTVKNAKSKEKTYRLFDEKGLYQEVSPTGGRWWRLKYRFNGKEKRLSLGTYPEVSLKDARIKRDEMRKLLAADIDPSAHRKMLKAVSIEKSIYSFEVVAREWLNKTYTTWSKSHAERIVRLFERDLFPWLGTNPIADITPPQILDVLRKVESRGAIETAHRGLKYCSQVFRYGVAVGRVISDPTRDLRGALTPYKHTHFAAPVDPIKLGKILRMFDEYEGTFIVSCALRIAPLVFVRPLELRTAKWEDINYETAEWRFTVTKTNTPHIVPLSTQVLNILQELQPLTCHSPFVFPSARSKSRPMSDNAILSALRSLGIDKSEATGHGFRAVARTLLDEVLAFRVDLIEHQLAHAVRDPNGRAYNRTSFIAERKEMMQKWADYLYELKGIACQQ
jgi:integrase